MECGVRILRDAHPACALQAYQYPMTYDFDEIREHTVGDESSLCRLSGTVLRSDQPVVFDEQLGELEDVHRRNL